MKPGGASRRAAKTATAASFSTSRR